MNSGIAFAENEIDKKLGIIIYQKCGGKSKFGPSTRLALNTKLLVD